MLIVQEVLVNPDVVEDHFACNLQACKGACCWEGDWGAPLLKEELDILDEIAPQVAPYLTEEGRQTIALQGPYTYFKRAKDFGTTLVQHGACAFMTRNEHGIAQCGIELAYQAGEVDFVKPLSCQLYPVRAERDPHTGFEVLRYDRWDICKAACTKGEKEQIPVYRFVKHGLIRKFGQAWYEELEAAAEFLKTSGDIP